MNRFLSARQRLAMSTLLLTISSLVGCAPDEPQASAPQKADEQKLTQTSPRDTDIQPMGELEPVALLSGPMPAGVSVSNSGRIFITFPRWADPVEFTVAELRDGKAVPYPNLQVNKLDERNAKSTIVSAQTVLATADDKLWILDTGSVNFQPVVKDGPKLLAVDLRNDQVVKTIHLPPDVALKTTYLNDLRIDPTRGGAGLAYITDSSGDGPNGIIVVDLLTGRSWRKLNDHPSTKAKPEFVPVVEGKPLRPRPPTAPEGYLKIGSDGIALSSDGKRLYYCPLAGRHLYSVSTDALADPTLREDRVAATVRDHGDKGFASDGLESDAQGRIYCTDYENNAVRRLKTDGRYEILVQDARLVWPDTMSVASDGYLYVIANQLNRQPRFHGGSDLRRAPYVLLRTKIDAAPVQLKPQPEAAAYLTIDGQGPAGSGAGGVIRLPGAAHRQVNQRSSGSTYSSYAHSSSSLAAIRKRLAATSGFRGSAAVRDRGNHRKSGVAHAPPVTAPQFGRQQPGRVRQPQTRQPVSRSNNNVRRPRQSNPPPVVVPPKVDRGGPNKGSDKGFRSSPSNPGKPKEIRNAAPKNNAPKNGARNDNKKRQSNDRKHPNINPDRRLKTGVPGGGGGNSGKFSKNKNKGNNWSKKFGKGGGDRDNDKDDDDDKDDD